MNRYFDLPDDKQTLMIGVKVGSAAQIATSAPHDKREAQKGTDHD
jgi:hypothetical protein